MTRMRIKDCRWENKGDDDDVDGDDIDSDESPSYEDIALFVKKFSMGKFKGRF